MWHGNANNGGVKSLESNLLVKEFPSLYKATEFDDDIRRNLYNFGRTGWIGKQRLAT
tara:strand:+ start:2980 stop:3150 length:171 start_codon:yes stop_codon:yes gene_type:complete